MNPITCGMAADLLVGVHMRHLVHVVLLDSLEQVRADEGGVHALDCDVAALSGRLLQRRQLCGARGAHGRLPGLPGAIRAVAA